MRPSASEKILIVDDEADVRTFLGAVLKKHGYPFVTAVNGVAGWEVAQREKPRLVVLDLMMPRGSGADFYQQLLADDELRDTPVIVVSGVTTRHLVIDQAAAVFDKPIRPDQFIAAVRAVLGESE